MAASTADTNDSLCRLSRYYFDNKQMFFFRICCYTSIISQRWLWKTEYEFLFAENNCQSKNHFQNDWVGRTYLLVESGKRTAEANLLS